MGKLLENKFLIELRERKQIKAKAQAEKNKLREREQNERKKIMRRLSIADDELESGKQIQKDLENKIRDDSAENDYMRNSLSELRNKNDELKKQLVNIKQEFEHKVLNGAKLNMKLNKQDIEELMLEKHKREINAHQVLAYSKHMSIGSALHSSQERIIREKLSVVETELERTKMDIKLFRKKRWNEKGIKAKDLDVIRGVFSVKKRISADNNIVSLEDGKGVLKVARLS